MKRDKQKLDEKSYLNPHEACVFWGLSEVRFRAFIKDTGLPFVALYGGRRLVVRSEFEKFIRQSPEVYGKIVKCSREETQSTGC